MEYESVKDKLIKRNFTTIAVMFALLIVLMASVPACGPNGGSNGAGGTAEGRVEQLDKDNDGSDANEEAKSGSSNENTGSRVSTEKQTPKAAPTLAPKPTGTQPPTLETEPVQEENPATATPESQTAVAVVTDENGVSEKPVNDSAPPIVAQAIPTPEPPTATPIPQPVGTPPITSVTVPTAEPTSNVDERIWHEEFEPIADKTERTPQEIERLSSLAYFDIARSDGLRTLHPRDVRGLRNGETFKVYSSPTQWQEFTCGPEIGTSLDPSVNPTHTQYSHFLFLWVANPDAGENEEKEFCIGVSKYADWSNSALGLLLLTPNERRLLTRDLFDKLGYMGDGDGRIVFKYQVGDRSFTPMPDANEYWQQGADLILIPDLGGVRVCAPNILPNAIWSDERGFVGITLDDMETLLSRDRSQVTLTEENIAAIEQAREDGIYYVYMDGHIRDGISTCWRVINSDEVPYEPCLSCQYWAHYR